MSAEDPAARLESMIGDLDGYVSRRAEDLAQPMIDAADAAAAEQVRLAVFETERQKDLVRELRRRLEAAERHLAVKTKGESQ